MKKGEKNEIHDNRVTLPQIAKQLCGVYHGNHQNVKGQNVRSQEDIAKELGVDVRTIRPSRTPHNALRQEFILDRHN